MGVQVFRDVILCTRVNGSRSLKIVLPLPEFISNKELWVNVKRQSSPYTRPRRPRGGVDVRSTLSLTSALDGGGWSTPRSGRFAPGKDLVLIV